MRTGCLSTSKSTANAVMVLRRILWAQFAGVVTRRNILILSQNDIIMLERRRAAVDLHLVVWPFSKGPKILWFLQVP